MSKFARLAAFALFIPLVVSCAGPAGYRATQGATIGALVGAGAGALAGGKGGAAVGAGAGALIGAGIGGAVGALVGAEEAKGVLKGPQPIPWMEGKTVQVVTVRGYSYGMDVGKYVVEDQLRRRGVSIVDTPSPQYYPPSGREAAADFIAEFTAVEEGNTVLVNLRVLDAARKVRAIGWARIYYGDAYGYGGYGYGYRTEALRTAAARAVWNLH